MFALGLHFRRENERRAAEKAAAAAAASKSRDTLATPNSRLQRKSTGAVMGHTEPPLGQRLPRPRTPTPGEISPTCPHTNQDTFTPPRSISTPGLPLSETIGRRMSANRRRDSKEPPSDQRSPNRIGEEKKNKTDVGGNPKAEPIRQYLESAGLIQKEPSQMNISPNVTPSKKISK